MRALIHIKLLGEFALRIGDGKPVRLPSKSRALIAYLALQEGRSIQREAVSELLWPERAEEQSRNSLKQELYVLRRDGLRGLDAISSRDNAISLPPDNVVCDVHELRELTRAGADAEWEAIAGLYSGPLLDGFPPLSPGFDDFLASMRRALEVDVLAVLGLISDAAAERGDTGQCVAITERMLAIDPLREDTCRRLMRSYARAGRRADAVRVYNDAKALLRREMDVAPAAETEALIARIRDGQTTDPAASPERVTVPAVPWGGPPRIAVLPLRQSEDQPLPSHLSDGITADIITQLAGLRELTVISHGSTFGLRDPYLEPHAIGRKLDARYLVIGRIRRGGDRLRLTTELTEAESGQVIYSHTDDADVALSFDDQDRIVARLVNSLVPQVRETELRRIRGRRPNVLSVYEKVLLSREHITLLNRDHFGEAKALLDLVIQEDPGYGEAYALAAEWHGIMAGERWSADPAGEIEAVARLTSKALSFDNCNVRALVSYGHRRTMSYRDHEGAMKSFQHALDVAPCSAHAWAMSSYCFAFAGDGPEAVRRAKRALELSPFDREAGKFFNALCVAYYTVGNYEMAADCGRRSLAEQSSWRGTGAYTAASLAAIGRLREAREVAAETGTRSPGRRRIQDIVANHPYRDYQRRMLYGEHLRAAGFSD